MDLYIITTEVRHHDLRTFFLRECEQRTWRSFVEPHGEELLRWLHMCFMALIKGHLTGVVVSVGEV